MFVRRTCDFARLFAALQAQRAASRREKTRVTLHSVAQQLKRSRQTLHWPSRVALSVAGRCCAARRLRAGGIRQSLASPCLATKHCFRQKFALLRQRRRTLPLPRRSFLAGRFLHLSERTAATAPLQFALQLLSASPEGRAKYNGLFRLTICYGSLAFVLLSVRSVAITTSNSSIGSCRASG